MVVNGYILSAPSWQRSANIVDWTSSWELSKECELSIPGFHTFRLRHDLQFIDSRGSLLIRRAGSLSMPTCGRDIGSGCMPGGGGTMPVASNGTVIPNVMNVIRGDGFVDIAASYEAEIVVFQKEKRKKKRTVLFLSDCPYVSFNVYDQSDESI